MEVYKAVVGVYTPEGDGELLELTLTAKDNSNAYRQAIRMATKLNGVLTLLIHTQGHIDRILFAAQQGDLNGNQSRREDSGNSVLVEGSAQTRVERDVSDTVTGTGSEHNPTSPRNTEDI